jgi:hypothetical protein
MCLAPAGIVVVPPTHWDIRRDNHCLRRHKINVSRLCWHLCKFAPAVRVLERPMGYHPQAPLLIQQVILLLSRSCAFQLRLGLVVTLLHSLVFDFLFSMG